MIKNPPANAGDAGRYGFDSWVGKFPWRKEWLPTLIYLPGESHGQRSLAGYNPWDHKQWRGLTHDPDVGGWMCGWGAAGLRFLCVIIKDTK